MKSGQARFVTAAGSASPDEDGIGTRAEARGCRVDVDGTIPIARRGGRQRKRGAGRARTYHPRVVMRVGDLRRILQDSGPLDPVLVVGERSPYRLIDGFRRCTAARSLGWSAVMAIGHEHLDDPEALRMVFTRNAKRKKLTVDAQGPAGREAGR